MNLAQTLNAAWGRNASIDRCWVPRLKAPLRQWPVYVPTLTEPWIHVRRVPARTTPYPTEVKKEVQRRAATTAKITVVNQQILDFLRAQKEPVPLGAIGRAVHLPTSYLSGRITRLLGYRMIRVAGCTVIRGATSRLYEII